MAGELEAALSTLNVISTCFHIVSHAFQLHEAVHVTRFSERSLRSKVLAQLASSTTPQSKKLASQQMQQQAAVQFAAAQGGAPAPLIGAPSRESSLMQVEGSMGSPASPVGRLLGVLQQGRMPPGGIPVGGYGRPAMDLQMQQKKYANWQRWLLLLRHVSKCTAPEGTCTAVAECHQRKQLWAHVRHCLDPDCKSDPRCRPIKTLVKHNTSCHSQRCPTCQPVREKLHRQKQREAVAWQAEDLQGGGKRQRIEGPPPVKAEGLASEGYADLHEAEDRGDRTREAQKDTGRERAVISTQGASSPSQGCALPVQRDSPPQPPPPPDAPPPLPFPPPPQSASLPPARAPPPPVLESAPPPMISPPPQLVSAPLPLPSPRFANMDEEPESASPAGVECGLREGVAASKASPTARRQSPTRNEVRPVGLAAVKTEPDLEDCREVNHPNAWYLAAMTRCFEEWAAGLETKLKAGSNRGPAQREVESEIAKMKVDLNEMKDMIVTEMTNLKAEKDEALRGKLQVAEEAKQEMGVEWLGRKLAGRDWRNAREEKGLFSERRELPRNFPFRAISSKRVTSELHFLLERGIESKNKIRVHPPFDTVEVLIKQSKMGAEGLFCGGQRIESGKLIGVYGWAETHLDPIFQPGTSGSQRPGSKAASDRSSRVGRRVRRQVNVLAPLGVHGRGGAGWVVQTPLRLGSPPLWQRSWKDQQLQAEDLPLPCRGEGACLQAVR